MSTNIASGEEGNFQIKRNLDDWKYPKISMDQVYKKKILNISPSYAVRDYENTIILSSNDQNVCGNLLTKNFLESLIKKQHRFVHLGLVQIAIKPLMRDGLGGSIVVSLRDARHLDFHNSLLALVKANLYDGPFYFNCFPSFSVSLDDASLLDVLTIDVESGGIPLALTYRIMCKAMVDLSSQALKEPVLGETTYFQPASRILDTTRWDEVELHIHESSTSKQEPEQQDQDITHTIRDDRFLKKGNSTSIKANLDDWKYPKIPVEQVYNSNEHNMMLGSEFMESLLDIRPSLWSKVKKAFTSSQTVRDYEKTKTLKANNQRDVSLKILKGFIRKRKNGYAHLGLIQIAIKPLIDDDDGLEESIIVWLRDTRFSDYEDTLLALVQANVSQGPFYFNCCPGYTIAAQDIDCLRLCVSRRSRVPIVLTYRLVCNVTTSATSDLRDSLVRGETTYYLSSSGTQVTTKWDEVQPLSS